MTSKGTKRAESGPADQALPVEGGKNIDQKLLENARSLSDELSRLGIDPKPGYRIEPALGGHLSTQAATARRRAKAG